MGGPAATAKELRRAKRQAFIKAAQHWHASILPQHFETSAVRKYNYVPRTIKYMQRKAKARGHQRPLVWNGQLWIDVEQNYRITGNREGGAQVIMRGPKYLYAYHKTGPWGLQVNKAKELTTTTTQELSDIGMMIDKDITETLNQVPTRTWRRIA
jgi:hypothetical protein